MDLLRTNGAPVEIHRDAWFALCHRFGIVVEEPPRTFSIITSRPGRRLHKLPIDEYVRYHGRDPQTVQRPDFGSATVYEDHEIAERAKLALKQDNNRLYFVGNTDEDFVHKMTVKLNRDEWDSPYSETTTGKAFMKVRVYSPETELSIGDVVYVRRCQYGLWNPFRYQHVGVVVSVDPEIKIFHFNKWKDGTEQSKPGFVSVTSLQEFLEPESKRDRGLFRAVFIEGTVRSGKEILDLIDRFNEKDEEVLHKWAGISNPADAPNLEGFYDLFTRNCETVIFRIVRKDMIDYSPQVHDYMPNGSTPVVTVCASLGKIAETIASGARGLEILVGKAAVANKGISALVTVPRVFQAIGGGICAGAIEGLLCIINLVKNFWDYRKGKISPEEHKLLQCVTLAEGGIGAACVGVLIALSFAPLGIGGIPAIVLGTGAAVGLAVTSFMAKRKLRAHMIKKKVKQGTSTRYDSTQSATTLADELEESLEQCFKTAISSESECSDHHFMNDDDVEQFAKTLNDLDSEHDTAKCQGDSRDSAIDK